MKKCVFFLVMLSSVLSYGQSRKTYSQTLKAEAITNIKTIPSYVKVVKSTGSRTIIETTVTANCKLTSLDALFRKGRYRVNEKLEMPNMGTIITVNGTRLEESVSIVIYYPFE